MLTQLSTVKSRLSILDSDTSQDAILTNALKAVSARFDHETNRTLARTENATHEFDPTDTELSPPCYPIESVSKFETKSSESEGWLDQPGIDYLIRRACIISLQPLALSPQPSLARVTYTGGYLLPGSPPPDPPVAACQGLPDDLEQAAVEQVIYWFQTKEKLGLKVSWPTGVEYKQFSLLPLLPDVSQTLAHYRRWAL
ncbi:MAG TPA: hypothetical protein VG146_11930 [Verrucomicrobiae bacterium]|nr:hypothetical protein [Verrucomicrobiae bacterium]